MKATDEFLGLEGRMMEMFRKRDLKERLQTKLMENKQYIDKNSRVLPEIRNWKWSNPK